MAAGDGSAATEDYSAAAVNDAALEVAQELTGVVSYARGVQQEARDVASNAETADLHDKLPSAKLLSVEEGSDEHIGRAYDDGKHDAEAKGEELLTPDGAENAVTARQLVQESAAEYGANADLVAAAYEDGQDPMTFAQ